MQIISEKHNKLMKRKEMVFSLEAHSNPGFEGAKKSIVEKTKSKEENIAIKNVKNNYGSNQFIIEAFVYDSEDQKNKIEPKVKPKKGAAQ